MMEIKTSWEIKEWVEDAITRDYLDWNEIHFDRWGKEFDEVHIRDAKKWVSLEDFRKILSDIHFYSLGNIEVTKIIKNSLEMKNEEED